MARTKLGLFGVWLFIDYG